MVAVDWNPPPRAVRGFARLWLPLFVLTLGGILRWRFGLSTPSTLVWLFGAATVAASLASRAVARRVFVLLSIVTFPLAVVTSLIVLSVVFFLVITPIAWVMRARGHDALRLRRRAVDSHWQPRAEDSDPRRALRQF